MSVVNRSCAIVLAALVVLGRAVCFSQDGELLMGFNDSSSRGQIALEHRFDSTMNPNDLRGWMKRLSAHPHSLGSAYDRENAHFIDSLFTSWGFETRIEEFSALFPTPKTRVLELIEPQHYTALLVEPSVPADSTSDQASEQLPTYNVYSIDGDVTAELVYVNYGIPKDYDDLDQRGIDVKGKIVVARYGGAWRGIKPKVAAEHGAVGCVIYSDPRDDGYYQGDVYPGGSFRNENGVQRGSVADMTLYPGDPLTPFVGATKDAKRLSVQEAKTLTTIPVLPISYHDALPLLRFLGGPVAPEGWRGGLPITYHLGPGPAKAHLKLAFNWNMVPVYDVIAKIAGDERPDEWVIRGNHYDAWVNGAEDPLSGLVALLEEAKNVGQLADLGWKPKRTIIYAAWDGEEPGLIGSTEWVEAHADILKKNAVAYINSDPNGRGFLSVGGSHTLEKFVNQVARGVIDPEKNINLAERLHAANVVQASAGERRELLDQKDIHLSALGSGSDYTPFLQHLGIASLNIGFGGESAGGSYHSIYDSFDYFTRFVDPTFEYGIALARTSGRLVLRLADADVLPFEFSGFSETLSRYIREIVKLTDDMREETEQTNKLLSQNLYAQFFDPTKTFVPPKMKGPVPFLNFAPLHNALAQLQQSVRKYQEARMNGPMMMKPMSHEVEKILDVYLMQSERALTREEGLPRRPWFTHQIYAPGMYTGYGVKTLPAVREAIEQRQWDEAEKQIDLVGETLQGFSRTISRAADMITDKLKK
jgi:N-acetylated-alpha-linked acidic dipeptidase